MTSPSPNGRPNPYVGPRAFQPNEALYGRERETAQLLNLLIAERVVLLYSPSGAGKTSLIQAALLPRLARRRFQVLPVIRLNLEAPAQLAGQPGFNRYVYAALACLEVALPEEQQLPEAELAAIALPDYFARRSQPEGQAGVEALIFDQFEEILILDPTDQAAKREFFEQVGQILTDRRRWALFSMREDYVGALDPYVLPIPTRFSNTFRLDLLDEKAAREAIQNPARAAGVDFTDSAAAKLVDDLRQVQVQRADLTLDRRYGPYVEPVQLQVVCYRLWAGLPPDAQAISESEIESVGDVDLSLAEYYAERVRAAAEKTGILERSIRQWVSDKLISPQGIRMQVLREPEQSAGLADEAIMVLVDAHLVRAEQRRGATWYELAHDRLVKPVRADNEAWFQANLSVLQRQAELWNDAGRSDDLLLLGTSLKEAEAWIEAHKQEPLTAVEMEFLAACRKARAAAENQVRSAKRLRRLSAALAVALIFAMSATAVAISSWRTAQDAANTKATANVQLATANVVLAMAGDQRATEAMQEANAAGTAEVASTVAVAGQATAIVAQAESNTLRATADAARVVAETQSSIALTAQAQAAERLSPTEQAALQGVTVSRLIAAQARGYLGTDLDLALLLGVEAYRRAATDEATSLLQEAIQRKSSRTVEQVADWSIPPQQGSILALAFSPDAQSLAWGGSGAAAVWSHATRTRQLLGQSRQPVFSVAYRLDGRLLAWGGDDGTIFLQSPPDYKSVGRLERSSRAGVLGLAFSPDGQTLAAAQRGASLTLWNVASQSYQGSLSGGHKDDVWSVAWSPDGQYLASGSADGSVVVWDAAQRRTVMAPPKPHTGAVWSVVWDPKGKWLASSGRDGTIVVSDVNTGAMLGIPLTGHSGSVYSLAVSQDGTLLASGDDTGQIIVWDMSLPAAPRPIMGEPLVAHASGVRSLALTQSAAETLLASGDANGAIVVHRINASATISGALVESACRLASRKALTMEEWQQFLLDQPYHATCQG